MVLLLSSIFLSIIPSWAFPVWKLGQSNQQAWDEGRGSRNSCCAQDSLSRLVINTIDKLSVN